MRSFRPVALAAMVLTTSVAAAAAAAPAPESDEQKTLFALGMLVGDNLAAFNLSEAEIDMVSAGLKASLTGGDTHDIEPNAYQQQVRALAAARQKEAASAEKEASATFLAAAANKHGAVRTDSGLVYKILQEGDGASPAASDKVRVHYTGTLRDGTKFDSSHDRGQPAEFQLAGVIPCWTEGVQKIKVGGKAELICPSEIAYGDQGRPPSIPGGATLVFEVELLGIVQN